MANTGFFHDSADYTQLNEDFGTITALVAQAAASAAAAAASFDSFDDIYLGSKSANPTLDNDGNALVTGALYWNYIASEMRVWSGSAWASLVPAGSVTSVFTRSGNVVATSGDYTASQVTNVPAGNIAATNVQAALNELDSEKSAVGHTHSAASITGLAAIATSGSASDLGTGTLPAARLPALTGDVATSAGSAATTVVSASGSWARSGDITPPQITANQNDYNPTGLSTASVLRLTSDASRNITSLAGGADGRIITLINVGSFPIVIKDEDGATGTAANRFSLTGDITLNTAQAATFIYDATNARWWALTGFSLGTGVEWTSAGVLQRSALTGDVTASAGSNATTIANAAVTYAKMQNVSVTSRVLGRKTAGAGSPEELTLSDVLDLVGSAAQGDILYRGASGWARLGAGTSGYGLKTNGASADPAWAKVLRPDVTETITKGYTVTPNNIGTVSTGTTTPDPANGNYQYYTNNGAHTLAAPTSDCAIDILVTNGASAGSITFSGFTVSASTGDALTTTNTSKFILSIRRINAVATYTIKALQ